MLIGKVVGSVVSTRKCENLVGNKFMIVDILEHMHSGADQLIAIDKIGAGIGEYVLVAQGSAARIGSGMPEAPIDAAIVGIIDDGSGLSSGIMDMKELSSILQQNGIVGAGGAGFPTYAKLDERAETIILNCAECEPLLRLHRQLLEKHASEIADMFHTIAETVGAKEAIIGIKKAYRKTIEAVSAVIDNIRK